VSSRSSDSDLSLLRNAAVLFAQADLIVVWLVLGTSLWVRRLPWSLCGLSGVGLVLYTAFKGEAVVLGAFLAHIPSTAAVVGFLRWRGRRIGQATNPSDRANGRSRHQFTILDLFGAALGTAIAVSWLLRMEPPQSSPHDLRAIVRLTALLLPLAGLTLMAAIATDRQRWLVAQIVLSGSIAIFVPKHQAVDSPSAFCLLYAVHWFLLSSSLWVFRMCGDRLVRTASSM
jgi:hypothetical protein